MPTYKQRVVTAFTLLAVALVFVAASHFSHVVPDAVRMIGSAGLLIVAVWALLHSRKGTRS